MKIIKTIQEIRKLTDTWRKKDLKIGFVPTMGALHEGHLSLVKHAKKECDAVVVSIFVNPTQFGPKEDFKKYPRDLQKDVVFLKKEKTDVVFIPSNKSIYPSKSELTFDMPNLTDTMCGKSRLTHFQGVLLVVAKLFNIVTPHSVYFGQKDFQQALIIKQMARDLHFPVKIVICPIVREKDGLAMSSRNMYLSAKERSDALCLWHALKTAKQLIKKENKKKSQFVLRAMQNVIRKYSKTKIDYLTIRDAKTLQEIKDIRSGEKIVIVGAVCIGKTRLIDNIVLRV